MNEGQDTRPNPPWPRTIAGLAVLAVFLATVLVLWRIGILDRLRDGAALEQAVMQFGPLGPFLIIGLMTVAIVMSPIPSAPIALASGAAYGHYWGAFYVAIGSEIGALTAFGVARLIGYDALKAWLGTRLSMGVLHRFITSQNALMAVVFATRLMPFLSFDIISYAAGLTPLRTWRFAVATLFGIIPASFLLAHFGDELASGDWRRAGLTVLALGLITLLPLAWKTAPARYRLALKRLLKLG
ncbi:TVP38/TMEM64 family protein [Thalassospira sp. MIT1370]|uniref:TVP38/TMEM64 family protein n=1 Tax=unclassified Thalassospira TaxID=2648997 RepID=UPI00399B8C5C